ncbi:single-stranded DNA-binding protein (plasmid) [Bacillus subtilis]|nr:single-stranded DNA-binding protein [Bacillus subtilis]
MLNRFFVTGYTGKDLKKSIQGEKSYMYFNVGSKRDYKNTEGQYDTDWISFVAYDAIADLLDGVEKGTLLTIEGRITSFEKVENGKVKQHQSLVTKKVDFLSPKTNNQPKGAQN